MQLGLSLITLVMLGLLACDGCLYHKVMASEDSGSDDEGWWDNIMIPIIVAIIAGIAASWNFIQAKWNGHYFYNLIIKELGELEPKVERNDDGSPKSDGLLRSHMNKSFMHREILYNPTENKEFIFTVDNKLIYLTRQVWSAFDHNDIEQFLLNLKFISVDKRKRFRVYPLPYDKKKGVNDALNQWIDLVKKDKDTKREDVIRIKEEITETTSKTFHNIKIFPTIKVTKKTDVVDDNISPIFFRAPPESTRLSP